MNELKEFIKICNKMYIKQIKNILKLLEDSNIDNSVKNNLSASGELIINILKSMEKENINIALPCLRNVYEMTLKSIVLEDNKEIRNSYNKIVKKTEKDKMSEVRKYIGDNFNKYFYVLEKDAIFDDILGEGILTYIYNCLCRYSHATKVNEFVYLAQRKENLRDILNEYLIIFLIYPVILIYADAVCTKINLKDFDDEIFIVYTIITFNLINLLFKDKEKIYDLRNFSEKTLGEPDELFKIRIEKEKQIALQFAEDTDKQIKENNIQEKTWKIFCDYYLKKYFTKKQLEKFDEIIKNIR